MWIELLIATHKRPESGWFRALSLGEPFMVRSAVLEKRFRRPVVIAVRILAERAVHVLNCCNLCLRAEAWTIWCGSKSFVLKSSIYLYYLYQKWNIFDFCLQLGMYLYKIILIIFMNIFALHFLTLFDRFILFVNISIYTIQMIILTKVQLHSPFIIIYLWIEKSKATEVLNVHISYTYMCQVFSDERSTLFWEVLITPVFI